MGTRNPNSYTSNCCGGTWSYKPPQSSQVTKIAVFCQYGELPMALTTEATQLGPLPSVCDGWSDSNDVGITHETAGKVPFAMSLSTAVFGVTTCDQSGP